MKNILHFSKALKIIFVFGRKGILSKIIENNLVSQRALFVINIVNFFIGKEIPNNLVGSTLVNILKSLGPAFVKLGQALATRPDIVGVELANELAQLHDKMEPFSFEKIEKSIMAETGKEIKDLFKSFHKVPIAAASISQVHKGLTFENEVVAVKILRPGVEKAIFSDLRFFKWCANFLSSIDKEFAFLRLSEAVDIFEELTKNEMDLRLEAAAANELDENFKNDDRFVVPRVFWELTTKRMLVTSWIDGIKINDLDSLRSGKYNIETITKNSAEAFFLQVFRDGFFHADMHPGNIFIDAKNPSDPAYVAVDYAIVGSLSEEEQYQIGRMLVAVIARDFKEVANILIESKWVNPNTRLSDLENTIRAACEPIFDQPMEKINFGEMLLFIFDSARRFDLRMQPSLMLLQKTLVNIEGLGKQLYPALDFWSIANPFLKNWISERYNPKKLTEWAKRNSLSWFEKARKFPQIADTAIEQVSRLEEYQNANEERHNQLMQKIYIQGRNNGIILIVLIICLFLFIAI